MLKKRSDCDHNVKEKVRAWSSMLKKRSERDKIYNLKGLKA